MQTVFDTRVWQSASSRQDSVRREPFRYTVFETCLKPSPIREPAVAAAHGLRRYPGAVRVVATRLAQHYLWYVVDGGLDGVQLLQLLLLLLEHRINTTGESVLRRLDGVQLLLDSCLRLLLLELCVEKEIKTFGHGRYTRLNAGQSVGQLGQRLRLGRRDGSPGRLELGRRGYTIHWTQQHTADQQRWQQHGGRRCPAQQTTITATLRRH